MTSNAASPSVAGSFLAGAAHDRPRRRRGVRSVLVGLASCRGASHSPFMPHSSLGAGRFAAGLLAVFVSAPGFAQITVSNLAQADAGYTSIDIIEYRAQAFTTDAFAASYQLTSVTFSLDGVTGSPPSDFAVKLYSNGAGVPASSLATLPGSNNPVTVGNHTYTASGTTLSPNTTYWFVFLPTAMPARGIIAWISPWGRVNRTRAVPVGRWATIATRPRTAD